MERSFFNYFSDDSKASQNVRDFLKVIVRKGPASTGDLARECKLSVPTAAKTVDAMLRDGLLKDLGQRHKEGGRMPNMYGLNPGAGYFAGIDISNSSLSMGIINFEGEMVYRSETVLFDLDQAPSADRLADTILSLVECSGITHKSIQAYTISVPGRVNYKTGESYDYFIGTTSSTTDYISRKLGAKVYIDNDSRVMCYGEYIYSRLSNYENILFINLGWGLGMGMILGGKLFYGDTGFAGELGHVTMFDNEVFCRCGKKGCMETEASGWAALRLLRAKHQAGARSTLSGKIEKGERITAEDMVGAALAGDMLMIEIIDEIGAKLGRGIAAMVNIVNPGLVVIGGVISETGEAVLLSTVSSVRKNSITLANKETKIVLSKTGRDATVLGAAFMARDRMAGIL